MLVRGNRCPVQRREAFAASGHFAEPPGVVTLRGSCGYLVTHAGIVGICMIRYRGPDFLRALIIPLREYSLVLLGTYSLGTRVYQSYKRHRRGTLEVDPPNTPVGYASATTVY